MTKDFDVTHLCHSTRFYRSRIINVTFSPFKSILSVITLAGSGLWKKGCRSISVVPNRAMLNRLIFTCLSTCFASLAAAQVQETAEVKKDSAAIPVKTYNTKWVTGEPPVIDGIFDDAAWNQVAWGGDFVQRQPDDGKAPSQPTEFKILYDAKNLYVAIRAWDSEPNKIVKRMSRRDGFAGDWVEINIDSYYDKRTAFSFTASVSGVRNDEYCSNNGDNWDSSWDPIWYLKTSVDEKGWNAEFRIPLSQLRFADKPELIWGIEFTRYFFRNDERSVWQRIPQGAPGWVHLFGELHGIAGIKPQKQIEIMPYIAARTEHFEAEEGNPFADGTESALDVGVDGKIGITSDITLDFTVNPDFGQVEADPSQVNLSAFQLFFQERRPFFIEGKNILNFPITESVAGGSFNSDNLFYSRRIGRRPLHYPSLNDNEFADVPDNTRILGAAKLTGKNRNGLSWGILESVTSKAEAKIDSLGDRRLETVEPRTNYLVGRIQKDINKGNTIIGGMFTATHRSIEEEHLEFLHKEAYSAGIDAIHNWNNRKYYVRFNGVMSKVTGTPEAITRTQTANEHLYQRPTAPYLHVDSTRTSLTGDGGTVAVGKNTGDIIFQSGITWRSPGIELNDIGFLISGDLINHWTWAQYRILKPFSIFRSLRVNGNEYLHFDYGGNNTRRDLNFNAHTQFKNFWYLGAGTTIVGRRISNADLRGGPAIIYPGGLEYWVYTESDNRKKFRVNMEQWNFKAGENAEKSWGIFVNFSYRPMDALNISASPSYSFNGNQLQYVTTTSFNSQPRYITSGIDQSTFSMSLRFTYVITPDLSIEYWGQPFISTGEYYQFKRITDPDASEYKDRFHTFASNEISFNSETNQYDVDEDANGTVDYNIDNPDFNFAQFRSNMVVRWEYIPGSTLFLVWTQNRTDNAPTQEGNSFGHLGSSLFDKTAHNIFLIKYTYRFRF